MLYRGWSWKHDADTSPSFRLLGSASVELTRMKCHTFYDYHHQLPQARWALFEAILAASSDWLAVQILQTWSALHGILLKIFVGCMRSCVSRGARKGKIS